MPLSRAVDDPTAQTVKIGLIESADVELGLAIQGQAGAGPRIGQGTVGDRALLGVGIPRTLPGPEAEEVVVVPLQESEVRVKVQCWRRRQLVKGVVLEIAPRVRADQQNGLAAAVGEVAGIGRADPQRSHGRRSGRHGRCSE